MEERCVEVFMALNQIEMTEARQITDKFQLYIWEPQIKGKDENLEKMKILTTSDKISL